MASITSEYRRFLLFLSGREVDEDVRRLAAVVYTHLDHLAEFGATRRARANRLAPLAVRHLPDAAPIAAAELQEEPSNSTALRLNQLAVGPFRGFTVTETFDLSHDITLVYGANGTGKSSFCEALETAMLGSISEAQAKRLDLQTYCNNVRLRSHVPPSLTVRVAGAKPSRLVANEAEYRFCFIEKNRLDDFARIAARTPGDQRQLIATLFGVDQFAEFVRGFNSELDESLTLAGPKAALLAQRRQQLAASEQVVNGHVGKLKQQGAEEAKLAELIFPDQDYAAACAWLLGADGEVGRLATVQAILDAPTLAVHGITATKLADLLAEKQRAQAAWDATLRKLGARAGEVSFAQLYKAVQELSDGATECPACGTDLATAREDPFERARRGLLQLAELAELQTHEQAQRESLAAASRNLRSEMARTVEVAAMACSEHLEAAKLQAAADEIVVDWLAAWEQGEISPWARLVVLASEIERLDAGSKKANDARDEVIKERNKLDEFRTTVQRLRTQRAALQEALDAARATITQFEEANGGLIREVEDEKAPVALSWRIKAAYDGFLPELQSYLADLPRKLMHGLNERAKDLYNAFNRRDEPGDLLHSLSLPLAENGRIEIEFAGERGARHNALVLLSEGHIRCLGLAILLAKNIAQGCPVVIFDDVVNAIDDEHRDGIWRTFFEEGRLDGKQVILTSHSEEFLLRIQQELGAAQAKAMKRYKFLPHTGEHRLRVDTDPPTKNYVILARVAIDGDDKRDALRQCRPALESLTDQLWVWLSHRGLDSRIELKLSGPRSSWELNNKCLKLQACFNRATEQYPDTIRAVNGLRTLTGISGSTIEWSYLNSGVHDSERDHDFDGAIVRTIVGAVIELDSALTQLRRPRATAAKAEAA